MTQEQLDGRDAHAQGKVFGKGMGLPSSSHLHVLTNQELLWAAFFWVFMEASLHKHD